MFSEEQIIAILLAAFQIGVRDTVVVRSVPDKVKAIYNACRHRRNKIVHNDFEKGYRC